MRRRAASRRYISLSLAAALLLCAGVFFADAEQPAPAAAPARTQASGDQAFDRLAHSMIEQELKLYPSMATELGDHRYDNRLADLSRAGITRRILHANKFKRDFMALHPDQLSPANEADREWLIAQLDGQLLVNDQLRAYERSPGMYLPTAAIDSIIKRDFAPASVRMRSVIARETAALRNLPAARANLVPARTAKIAVKIVLMQMPATLGFFSKEVPAAFASVPDGTDKEALRKASAKLIAALKDYQKWLQDDLMPKASGNYAIGAGAYRRMLEDDDMVDVPLSKLTEVGTDELNRLQADFQKTAHQIDPNHSAAEVVASLNRTHPAADQIIPAVSDGLAALRAFVVAHHLATIPSEVQPMVRETPPFMRATTFASMDTPGPFEKTSEAFFYVTLPDPSWPKSRQEQLLEFFSPPLISDTSTHEVYPGHYVQFLNNRLNPDPVRKIYGSGANFEGWALYCEQMMLDEGLHNGDPKYRLAQLQMALLRACRYLVGIRMHTEGMTVEQAQDFFEKNAYMTPHNAQVEALRGTEDPGYLRYQLGKLMILKLREDVRRKEGASFDLGKFHDAFLRQGAIPIRLIRRAMLGSDAPLL